MGSIPTARSKFMQRQRIVKLVATVESEKQDWGFLVKHPTLGLVASADTEAEALEKMDKLITRTLEFGLAHSNLKFAKPAKAGK